MPKMKAITNFMKGTAKEIEKSVLSMQESQNQTKKAFQIILVHFDSTPKVMSALHLANVQNGYRNSGESLTEYHKFLDEAAETYEFTDKQIAQWADRLQEEKGVDIYNDLQEDSEQNNTTPPNWNIEQNGEVLPGNFEKAMEIIFFNEGGYSNDPDDPGGATNMGITQATLNSAYQNGIVSHNDVARLSQNEAMEIYRKMYWEASNADDMPEPLATIYFDTVVLCGAPTGGIFLQKLLKKENPSVIVDGYVGKQTLAALNEQIKTPEDVSAICNELLNLRQEYHNKDVNAWKYLAGWTNRVNRMRELIA